MLFTKDGQLLSSITEDWRRATAEVDTPRDLFEPENYEEWKNYASALPPEKQIAKTIELVQRAHDLWQQGPVASMTQDDKLSLYSAFKAASFLIHRLHIRLDYSSPDDRLFSTDRAAYEKIIGPRDDRMLYLVQKTLTELGVNEKQLDKFGAARNQYREMVGDENFITMERDFSRRSLEVSNQRLSEERKRYEQSRLS